MPIKELLLLFLTFFKIGLFTFGGGYAMIPMIEEEVLKQGWLDSIDTLVDFVAISESTPTVRVHCDLLVISNKAFWSGCRHNRRCFSHSSSSRSSLVSTRLDQSSFQWVLGGVAGYCRHFGALLVWDWFSGNASHGYFESRRHVD